MQSVILREIAFSVSCQRPVRRQGGRRSKEGEKERPCLTVYIYIKVYIIPISGKEHCISSINYARNSGSGVVVKVIKYRKRKGQTSQTTEKRG